MNAQTERLRQRGVRLEVIGRRDRLPKLLLRGIEQAEFVTAGGRRLHLRPAVDYSSRDGIARAAAGLATAVAENFQPSADLVRGMLARALMQTAEKSTY